MPSSSIQLGSFTVYEIGKLVYVLINFSPTEALGTYHNLATGLPLADGNFYGNISGNQKSIRTRVINDKFQIEDSMDAGYWYNGNIMYIKR